MVAKYVDHKHKVINGKVVARFWCGKVEKIHCNSYGLETSEHWYRTQGMYERELLEKSCLTFEELDQYLCWNNGYAIHIPKLEIFDKPKELREFDRCILTEDLSHDNIIHIHQRYKLTKAPQNFMFVDID